MGLPAFGGALMNGAVESHCVVAPFLERHSALWPETMREEDHHPNEDATPWSAG